MGYKANMIFRFTYSLAIYSVGIYALVIAKSMGQILLGVTLAVIGIIFMSGD